MCAAWQELELEQEQEQEQEQELELELEQKLGDGDVGKSTDNQGPVQYTEKTPSAAMKSKSLTLLSATLHQGDLDFQPVPIH